MAQILRKILAAGPSVPKEEDDDDDDNDNIEYSFAVEYSGPPVTYDVPHATPINVQMIPTAAPIASASLSNVLSIPVIQPIVKTKLSTNKHSHEVKAGSEFTVSPIATEVLTTSVVLRELSVTKDNLDVPANANSDTHMPEVCDETKSQTHSGSSQAWESPDGDEENGDRFQDHIITSDLELVESVVSYHSASSEISSPSNSNYNSGVVDVPLHVRRPSIVTFRDPEFSSNASEEESDISVAEDAHEIERIGKKGTCYRCLKGNRFTEKEICIVCGAKYCCNCVIRVMGSMPEGRKCIACIGERINEKNRKKLGKFSWMLKRLLSQMEVEQRMKSERYCEVNQLPSEFVYVNDEQLSQGELVQLQTCANPPKKLKPGNYWYDKVSGFWGKVGDKPCQIVSSQLNVGGHLKKSASNGNTNIFINNREITKPELWMLKAAGVQCEGTSSFWLNDDGSYQEEGMNNVKGRIWGRTRVNIVCAALSLPLPPNSVNSGQVDVNKANQTLPEQKIHGKFLLVGNRKSGTSTIFKQARLLYNAPFTADEREDFKVVIQTNLYSYIGILLEGREQFEEECLIERRKSSSMDQCGPSALFTRKIIANCPSQKEIFAQSSESITAPIGRVRKFEMAGMPSLVQNSEQKGDKSIYSFGPRLKSFADWFVKVMASGNLEAIFPAATREYAPYVEDLWKDAAFKATYDRRDELKMLPRVATHFLERAVEISRPDYEPSDMDILYAEGSSYLKGIPCMEYSLSKSVQVDSAHTVSQPDTDMRYQLIRVHPRNLGENCKWLEMFADMDMVIFCVSLTDYTEYVEDSNGGVRVNKMMASKQLLKNIVTHPTFEGKDYLLLLNKFDELEETIDGAPLTGCEWFDDFNPVISQNSHSNSSRYSNPTLAHRAFQYIAVKFKRWFRSLTGGKKLYVSLVKGMVPDSVDEALKYAREVRLWEGVDITYVTNEVSTTSVEISTSS